LNCRSVVSHETKLPGVNDPGERQIAFDKSRGQASAIRCHIVVLAGLAIGLVYGAVGLLSGFLPDEQPARLVGGGRQPPGPQLCVGAWRAAATTQLLAAGSVVDLAKSIYLATLVFRAADVFGGLLFGYGMVLSNGCGSRALVLLRSLAICARCGRDRARHRRADDPEGLDRADANRPAAVVANDVKGTSLPELLSMLGIGETLARRLRPRRCRAR